MTGLKKTNKELRAELDRIKSEKAAILTLLHSPIVFVGLHLDTANKMRKTLLVDHLGDVEIPDMDIIPLSRFYEKYGESGLIAWVCFRKNRTPNSLQLGTLGEAAYQFLMDHSDSWQKEILLKKQETGVEHEKV